LVEVVEEAVVEGRAAVAAGPKVFPEKMVWRQLGKVAG
jgi:hypothetical protein